MQPHNPIPPHSRLPAKPLRKGTPRWLPWVVLGGATLLGTLMVVALFGLIAITYLTQPRIPAGTSIAGVDISGETLDSASEMLQTVEVGAQMVTLTDDARSWQISMSDLDTVLKVKQQFEVFAENVDQKAAEI